jgi:ABC-2 type transport system permease protein
LSGARLVRHQLRYDLLVALRNPQSRFFTLALPVIFLVIFSSVFGDSTTRVNGQSVKNSTFYLPGIATLGIVAVSFVNLVITIVVLRESGVLKRRRSTPVPAWVLIAGRTITAVILAAVIVAILVAIGRVAYGVHMRAEAIPAFALTVAVGAACFCCISYAVSSFIRSEDSAQPIIQAIVLPLYFISGVFIPRTQLSSTLRDVGNIFPISHLNAALFKAFDPTTRGAGIAGHDLLVLAIWGAAGLAVGLWRFTWAPMGA